MLGNGEKVDTGWEAGGSLIPPKKLLVAGFPSCEAGILIIGGAICGLLPANNVGPGRGRGGDLIGGVEDPE